MKGEKKERERVIDMTKVWRKCGEMKEKNTNTTKRNETLPKKEQKQATNKKERLPKIV